MHGPAVKFPINLAVIYHIFTPHDTRQVRLSSFGRVLEVRCKAASSTSHINRLIHPYIVKRNTVVRSKHIGPLQVRATLWQENNKEVEIARYTTASQR